MSVVFLFSGKQLEYISGGRENFRVDYQKNTKPGDLITIDKVLSDGDTFGQPYIKSVILQARVLKHGKNKKIIILKYKPKKRYKKKMGFRSQYTEIQIIKVDRIC